MKHLIVRDDDFSFWTDVSEIQEKYSLYLENGNFVSFGIIPIAVKSFNLGNYNTFFQDFENYNLITHNKSAVNFIKSEIKKSRIDFLLHGFEHKYFFHTGDLNKILPATYINLEFARSNNEPITFIGEFNQPYLTIQDYIDKIILGNDILENTFGISSKIFVPPSNQICSNSLTAIQKCNLSISGLYGKNVFNLLENIKRLYYPIRHNIFYPYIYKNITNQLTYHSLTTESNFDDLINKLEISSKFNAPFQIATHYWELNFELKNQLFEITKFAKKIGYTSQKLSNILT